MTVCEGRGLFGKGSLSTHLFQVGRQEQTRRQELLLLVHHFSLSLPVTVRTCLKEKQPNGSISIQTTKPTGQFYSNNGRNVLNAIKIRNFKAFDHHFSSIKQK